MNIAHLLRTSLRYGSPWSIATTVASTRFFNSSSLVCKSLPPRPKPPPDSEIEESYLKGSGPGGQKINKTNSAVQLKHIPTGIVVKSQGTRSRSQNRKLAREILAEKVDNWLRGDQSRSAIVGVIKKKKSDSAAKKSRRKYKSLEAEEDSSMDGAVNLSNGAEGNGGNAPVEPAVEIESADGPKL